MDYGPNHDRLAREYADLDFGPLGADYLKKWMKHYAGREIARQESERPRQRAVARMMAKIRRRKP